MVEIFITLTVDHAQKEGMAAKKELIEFLKRIYVNYADSYRVILVNLI